MARIFSILALLIAAGAVWFFTLRSPAPQQVVSAPVSPARRPPVAVAAASNAPVAKVPVAKSAVAQVTPGVAASKPPGPVEHFSDTRIPFERRLAEVQALGRKGDPASIRTLMQLGDAPIYINRYAVEALGQCPGAGADVRSYLAGKVNGSDALLAIAAIKALGQVASSAAIPALEQALRDNQTRPDGLQTLVCEAAVQQLGLTASPAAAPALIGQLRRAGTDAGWNLDYGSAVIHALRNMDSADGAQAIAAYADVLEARLPAEPMARAFYQRKIAEARGTARNP